MQQREPTVWGDNIRVPEADLLKNARLESVLPALLTQILIEGRIPPNSEVHIFTDGPILHGFDDICAIAKLRTPQFAALQTSHILERLESLLRRDFTPTLFLAMGAGAVKEPEVLTQWEHALTRLGIETAGEWSDGPLNLPSFNHFSSGLVVQYGNGLFRSISNQTINRTKDSGPIRNLPRGFLIASLFIGSAAQQILADLKIFSRHFDNPYACLDTMQEAAVFVFDLIRERRLNAVPIWQTGLSPKAFGYLQQSLKKLAKPGETMVFHCPDFNYGKHPAGSLMQFLTCNAKGSLFLDFSEAPNFRAVLI